MALNDNLRNLKKWDVKRELEFRDWFCRVQGSNSSYTFREEKCTKPSSTNSVGYQRYIFHRKLKFHCFDLTQQKYLSTFGLQSNTRVHFTAEWNQYCESFVGATTYPPLATWTGATKTSMVCQLSRQTTLEPLQFCKYATRISAKHE